jgi:hypothetical protein
MHARAQAQAGPRRPAVEAVGGEVVGAGETAGAALVWETQARPPAPRVRTGCPACAPGRSKNPAFAELQEEEQVLTNCFCCKR